ncbi:MAG TPA: tetratricopeptide repeat protein [Abditibacterium sp.]|jgi:tetratricopeptide (TPR) repeat protein
MIRPIFSSRRAGATNTFLLALVAALAVGLGVTGTLLWTQNRAAVPASAPPASAAPNSAVPGAASVPPPPSIAGLTPPQAALTLGNYYYDIQNWPQAVASYRTALAGGLDNANVRTDYGNALRFSGEPQKALEQYQIAQKQDPNHEQSLFNQGGLLAFSLKDKAKGVAAWRSYVKRFPQGQSVLQAQQFIKQNS